MGFHLRDLDGAATIVVGIVGLFVVLAPLANFILQRLQPFQFGWPQPLGIIAEVASCGTFFAVLTYRNSLHHLPPFWVSLIALIITFTGLIPLKNAHNRFLAAKSSFATPIAITGLIVYALSASLFAAALTQLAAQHVIFRPVYGSVVGDHGHPLSDVSVFCTNGSATMPTRTNSHGHYQFLLTAAETSMFNELRAGRNERLSNNFEFMNLDAASFPYERQLRWVP